MKWNSVLVGTGALSVLLSSCSPKTEATSEPAPAPDSAKAPAPAPVVVTAPPAANKKETVSFTKSIKPILTNKCTICHNVATLPNRPSFETRENALKSGVIVPGKPESSRMLTVIQEDPAADKAMPPVGHRLTAQEIGLLKTWIAEGAHWPSGKAGRVTPAFIPKE